MSTPKHTPGPWKVVDEKYQSGSPCKTIRRVDDKSAYSIAVIGDRMPSPSQWTPNAHLIAASPDLLHAAERMLELWNSGGNVAGAIELMTAAINKARGT